MPQFSAMCDDCPSLAPTMTAATAGCCIMNRAATLATVAPCFLPTISGIQQTQKCVGTSWKTRWHCHRSRTVLTRDVRKAFKTSCSFSHPPMRSKNRRYFMRDQSVMSSLGGSGMSTYLSDKNPPASTPKQISLTPYCSHSCAISPDARMSMQL